MKNKDKAIISKKLVTLKKDAPIKESIEDFKLREIDKDKLYKFLREMEFNRLLSSVISTYGEPELSNKNIDINSKENRQTISKKNYYLIKDINEIDKWIEEAEEVGELAIDTETSSLDVHQADLVGISLSTKIGKACYIPIAHKSKGCLQKESVIKKLKPLLEDKSVKKNWTEY